MVESWAIYNPKIDCFWRHKGDSWQQLSVVNWNPWQPLSFPHSAQDARNLVYTKSVNTPQFINRIFNSYLIAYDDITTGKFPLDRPLYEDATYCLGVELDRLRIDVSRTRPNQRIDEYSIIKLLIAQKKLSMATHCLVIDPIWYFELAISESGRHIAYRNRNDPNSHSFGLAEHLPGSYAQVEPIARSGHVLFFENPQDMVRFKLGSPVAMEARNFVKEVQDLLDKMTLISGRKAELNY